MSPDIEALVDKGRRSLDAANQLFASGHHDFAAARAYYAMFYLATALLALRSERFSRHSALIARFGQRFVATGGLPAEHQVSLQKAFELRGVADYEVATRVTEAQARDLLDRAARFVNDAEAWLRRAGG